MRLRTCTLEWRGDPEIPWYQSIYLCSAVSRARWIGKIWRVYLFVCAISDRTPHTTAIISINLLYILHLLPCQLLLQPNLSIQHCMKICMQSLHTNSVKPCKSTPTNPPSPAKPSHAPHAHHSYNIYQSTLHPTPPSPSVTPLTPSLHAKLHEKFAHQQCEAMQIYIYFFSKPRQTTAYSSCTPQLLSLSIYSMSNASFPVYYSSNPFFACKICMQPPLLCLKTIISMNLLYILHLLPRLLLL